jgi:hypothetical protein
MITASLSEGDMFTPRMSVEFKRALILQMDANTWAALDIRRVRAASLVLRRATNERQTVDDVVCSVTLEMHNGEIERLRGAGAHPYAAVNAVVEHLRLKRRDVRHARSLQGTLVTE